MTTDGDDPYDIAATYWARLQSGKATSADEADMECWRAQAPEHCAAMDAVKAAWESAGRFQDSPALSEMKAQMKARYKAAPAPASRRWRRSGLLAASIAALVAIPTLIWLMGHSGQHMVQDAPAERQMTREEGTRLFSPAGRRRNILLPDGSRVVLDADSAIRFAFSAKERSIDLERGRAYFAVHRDKSWPFIVSAGRLTATAVGTAFDVSRLSGREQVTTTEGVVRVVTKMASRDGHHTAMIPAGMRLTQDASFVSVGAVDAVRESAWRDGRIIFTAQCLSDVAAQMNRYAPGRLMVTDMAARIVISGVFEIDNADGLAEALEQQGLVHVDRSADRIILTPGANAAEADCAGHS
ncbi:FecR domain-containing protein [Sphingobium sp. BYY-5]|uniref:FecR family protein n=1 Tax=Sphingobium sp. BYY-5 TaxID=2926400 RepID=UPI001FA74DE7|nr:FecR domain-containing protein [Sphingobium sp. BYY-5]MCI4592145.1 FecR domain-containing protein [Sphingobium sp. BYY-5]